MSRPHRIAYPNATYHVLNRFVDRHPFFRSDGDYARFLETYHECARAMGIRTFAWCVMPNHFHVVLQTPTACISSFLQRFLSRAARGLNLAHQRVGHLFQGRSKTLLVEDGAYFGTVVAYVLLNPVRASMVRDPMHYAWSSANETATCAAPRVERRALLELLDLAPLATPFAAAEMRLFRRWLSTIGAEENESGFRSGHRGSFLSTGTFRKRILAGQERRLRDLDQRRRRAADRLSSNSSWKDFIEVCQAFVARSDRHWKHIWATPAFAAHDLATYLAHVRGGWSYSRLQEADGDRAPLGTYSKVVSLIRNNPLRLAVAEELEVRCSQLEYSEIRISAV